MSRHADGLTGPLIVARSDFAPAGTRMSLGPEIAPAHVPAATPWRGSFPTASLARRPLGASQEIDGILLRGSFDLVTALEQLLEHDCADFSTGPADPLPAQTIVLGDSARVRSTGAEVEPGVVFDVRHGVIVIDQRRRGAERHAARGTDAMSGRGPGCWVGTSTRRSSGPRSVVRGEVSSTIFNGYANKAHDGFVGHSVIGHWVNLGAGTTTSNLKNTYGDGAAHSVRPHHRHRAASSWAASSATTPRPPSARMLPTGTVVGAGANVFGAGLGKYVPPFSWGASGDVQLTEDGFLRIAERVMPRRDVAVTAERRASLISIFRRLSAR